MFIHTNTITPINLKTIEGPNGRFYITPEGNKYPSITTVLGSSTKDWVQSWRTSLGPAKADKETKRAADRGTAVHSMIEAFLNNDSTPTAGHKTEHITEFNTLRLHLKQINPIVCQETQLWSDLLQVAGRLDCVGYINNTLSIIDFKTATNSKTVNMVEDYWLQVTAYCIMLQERFDIRIDQGVLIISVERGAVPLVYKQPIEQYISPLLKRINTYHNSQGTR